MEFFDDFQSPIIIRSRGKYGTPRKSHQTIAGGNSTTGLSFTQNTGFSNDARAVKGLKNRMC